MQPEPGEKRQQHGQFEPVHVLRRHGRDDPWTPDTALPVELCAQHAGIQGGRRREAPEGFGVRARPAGRAGGMSDRSDEIGLARIRIERALAGRGHEGVVDRHAVRVQRSQLRYCSGRTRRRHQHRPAHRQCRCEQDEKPAAILAQVEEFALSRQGCRRRGDIRPECMRVHVVSARREDVHVVGEADAHGMAAIDLLMSPIRFETHTRVPRSARHQQRPPLTEITWRVT